jgi:GT2 family glycosyltransferase
VRRRSPSRRSIDALRHDVEVLRTRNEDLQSRLYDAELTNGILQGGDESYYSLVRRVREAVRQFIPEDCTVTVVTKGDPALIDVYGREAWHFPRASDGRYAGYHPRRGLSAVAHLETIRARGATHLLIPQASEWWLDHYPDFARHLEDHYRQLEVRDTCLIYAVADRVDTQEQRPVVRFRRLLDAYAPFLGDDPSILAWDGMHDELEAALPGRSVFGPISNGPTLPYLRESVDIVVVDTGDERRVREAARIASKLVVNLAGRPRGRKPTTRYLSWKSRAAAVRMPSVSIVIPYHDGLAHTAACITSLRETLPPWFRGEVIVVDDASSDGTNAYIKEVAERDPRVHLIRNALNGGFVYSCNTGARAAKGDFLLFLNNDTILLPGWLPPLLRTFADFPDAGVVGGKLLFEDGVLQEAGALVFADGSAAKIGYLDPDVQAPIYEYVRETDYVSAAFLMTPRSLFADLGGFDLRYGFGYYDDDDYCFAVRAIGRRVLYQPESVIVHAEGATAGTDPFTGPKRSQVVNQGVFAAKWADVLTRQPVRPAALEWHSLRWLETTRPGMVDA